MVNFIYLHNLILGPFHYSELYFEYYFGKGNLSDENLVKKIENGFKTIFKKIQLLRE